MSEVHAWVGFTVVALFAIGWLWPLGAVIARRGPGERYWLWLTVAQVVAGIQALIGIVLLLMGRRPSTWLHFVYGFGPIVILVIAHALARDLQKTQPGCETDPAVGAVRLRGLHLFRSHAPRADDGSRHRVVRSSTTQVGRPSRRIHEPCQHRNPDRPDRPSSPVS